VEKKGEKKFQFLLHWAHQRVREEEAEIEERGHICTMTEQQKSTDRSGTGERKEVEEYLDDDDMLERMVRVMFIIFYSLLCASVISIMRRLVHVFRKRRCIERRDTRKKIS
jgi:hypothetical protein